MNDEQLELLASTIGFICQSASKEMEVWKGFDNPEISTPQQREHAKANYHYWLGKRNGCREAIEAINSILATSNAIS